jgi:sec-independent protein translocase protein TatA
MGEFSIYHWLIVILIVVLLFGGRKIPELMRGLGEGIRHFKDEVNRRPGQTDTSASTQADEQAKK